MTSRIATWFGKKVDPKVVFVAALSAFMASSFVAWATQTNYLGTVFIADNDTPANQLSVTSGGGAGISGVYNSSAPTITNGNRGDVQVSSRAELIVRPSASGALISAGNPSDGLSNGIQVFQENAMMSVYNGSTWDRMFACTNQASATVTAGATTEIVALTASQVIRVCAFTIGMSASGTVKFVQGTGTNCGTGTADIMPATQLSTGNVLAMGNGSAAVLRTSSANALCVTAATGNAQVYVSYAKY
jgi:hypothetical protein